MLVALSCGLAAALVVVWLVPWQLTVLVAWDVTALILVTRVWLRIWFYDPVQTRVFAMSEDDRGAGSELLLLLAGTASLAGAAFAFVKAHQVGGYQEVLLEAMGFVTIALSWLVVHTVFTLRYADFYYREPVGGIEFNERDDFEPDYRDFAYMAFTVGMTYQVSDTNITWREMRRTVLRHALLSFVFGSVILAATVNVIASLLNS